MQFLVHSDAVQDAHVDLLAIGVVGSHWQSNPAFAAVDQALEGALKQAVKDEDFKGKAKQRLVVHTLGKLKAKRVALLGLGTTTGELAATLGQFGGLASSLGRDVGAKHLLIAVPEFKEDDRVGLDVAELVCRGAALGMYSYDTWRSDKGRSNSVVKISLNLAGKNAKIDKKSLARAEIVATSVALARDLVNTPPIELFPASFAKIASDVAKKSGLKIKVLEPAELKKLGMNLLLGVGAGSARPPRLVHLSYEPKAKGKGKAKPPVVLVGKGITFDTGGLSLKPSASMVTMKMDMGGAATVLGTMQGLAKLKPDRTIHGILALAENMPSGTAIRPDDVIKSAAGKTVEINNTDAEGRLVLADALHYAVGLKPERIIDLATLTGACVVALGNTTVGTFSNDDDLANDLLQAARLAGEDFWRLPLTSALKEQLKSDVADMRNTGERFGGAITAALFLQEFVGDAPWAHLDIAGPAMSTTECGNMKKGGTGVGVATLLGLLA